MAQQAYIEQLKPATDRNALHSTIMTAITGRWAESKKWAEGFVMSLPNWLRQQCWLEAPEPAQPEQKSPYVL
jgi:hypothetical protein